jgi:microcystin-dependent protein
MAYTQPRDWTAGETLTAALMDEQLKDNLLAAFPPGKLEFFVRAATTTETLIGGGWLECNGVAVSRTTYSALNTVLSALSYPFGNGNGTTTFNIPDLQGRSLVAMASGGHADVNGLGDSDGLAKTSRSPTHNTTQGSLGVAGAPGTGSLAASGTFVDATATTAVPPSSGAFVAGGGTGTPGITGAPDIGTLAITGAGGPGGTRPNDTVPYLVAGVWAIKT